MKRRFLGQTGIELSLLGLGGVVLDGMDPDEACCIVAEAVDRGINYFDVAPRYGDAEEKLGFALKSYRQNVFLSCKSGERGRENVLRELENSLGLLRTDYLDLYQLHAVEPADVEQIFRVNGAIEALQQAKEAGKVRLLGFSSHSPEAAVEIMKRFKFDTVLFPVNFPSWFAGVGPQVLAEAQQQGLGRLAIKSIAKSRWPDESKKHWKRLWYMPLEDKELINLAVRFTLSQDITATVGPGEAPLFRLVLRAAEHFEPITEEELQRLKDYAGTINPLFSLVK